MNKVRGGGRGISTHRREETLLLRLGHPPDYDCAILIQEYLGLCGTLGELGGTLSNMRGRAVLR